MECISSDTNIWFRFYLIHKKDLPFRLPWKYIMYQEVLINKKVSPSCLQLELQNKGVICVDMTIEEFYYASELADNYVKLSGYESIALSIAKNRNIRLLTDNDALKKAAVEENVEFIDTSGLLEKLYHGEYITKSEYEDCLNQFLISKETRLSHNKLKNRIDGPITE